MKWFPIILVLWSCFDVDAYKTPRKPKWLTHQSMKQMPTPIHPTIQIAVHIDQALTKKLLSQDKSKNSTKTTTKRKLKWTTEKIIKDAEKYFNHPSLDLKLKLKLMKTRFLKNDSRIVTMSENATVYLSSYCQWQSKRKKDVNYFSVLFTGLDIYAERKKNGSASTGRGYMRSICNEKKSCAVLAWRPKNMPYLLAHELAHSIGVPHDGKPYNSCKSQGYMMTAKYNPRRNPSSWSSCSSRVMKAYLRTRKTKCLWPDYYETVD